VSFLSRHRFIPVLWGLAAVWLFSTAGCSGGLSSGGPKNEEGGGPIPADKVVEEPEEPMKMPPGVRAVRKPARKAPVK
jgi:hypothetical protein